MFKVFQHVLPLAKAWRLTIKKPLTRFFDGLGSSSDETKNALDKTYAELDPYSTTNLTNWEKQFGLPKTGLSESERRARLSARWKDKGGQDPDYIQATLQAAGFDVYVHDWWEPGIEPPPGVKQCVTPRNPLQWLRREYTGVYLLVECGEPDAACGEAFAECGNSLEPAGYPLVNKVFRSVKDEIILCGEAIAECGEIDAECGAYYQYIDELVPYIVPEDPEKWPYFLYIGGETFGEMANVPQSRKNELEALCLKICPTQLWLGMLVDYS